MLLKIEIERKQCSQIKKISIFGDQNIEIYGFLDGIVLYNG